MDIFTYSVLILTHRSYTNMQIMADYGFVWYSDRKIELCIIVNKMLKLKTRQVTNT